jgi:hypothetical protein
MNDTPKRLSLAQGHAALARWHEWLKENPAYDPAGRVRDALALRQRVNAQERITARDYEDLIDMVVDEAFPFDSKDQFRAALTAAHTSTISRQ